MVRTRSALLQDVRNLNICLGVAMSDPTPSEDALSANGGSSTLFARSDAAVTVYFIAQFCAASIREQLLIESGVY